ncbi:MAG: hypothetical protein MUC62_06225 [Candidatus Thermoplasmatota archaeon]|nr:hypothetical protein [Candidatus Thermoplasmatota archaeon]
MNHWSDYTGPDDNSDRIVDAPYNISGEAKVNDSEPIVDPYMINVTGAVFPLRILTSDRISVKAGTAYSVEYKSTEDPLGSNRTWSMKTNASWLSFSDENVLYGSPNISDIGVYWVNISVTDGKDGDLHIFNIYVYETIDPTVGSGKNQTQPGSNDTNHGTQNIPPQNPQILLPPGEMHEGEELVFSSFVYDPDLKDNETLNITWYIVGMGIVGYGSQITLELPKDNYTLIINVTDPKGASVQVERTIVVLAKESFNPFVHDEKKSWWESPWSIALFVLTVNLFITAFFSFSMFQREEEAGRGLISSRRPIPPFNSGPGGKHSGPSADEILDDIIAKGGPSHDLEQIEDIRSKAKRMYKEGKISRRTYGMIRRNLHTNSEEE